MGGPAAALVKIILSGDALKLANELELKHFTVNKTRECLPIYTFEGKRKAYIPAPIEYREWYNKNDITQSNVNVFTCFTNYSFEELEPPFVDKKKRDESNASDLLIFLSPQVRGWLNLTLIIKATHHHSCKCNSFSCLKRLNY